MATMRQTNKTAMRKNDSSRRTGKHGNALRIEAVYPGILAPQYNYQRKGWETTLATLTGGKQQPVNNKINSSCVELLWKPSVEDMPQSLTSANPVVSEDDYHQFYMLIRSVFHNGMRPDIRAEQVFNVFCQRLLTKIDQFKWSSLIGFSDHEKREHLVHNAVSSPPMNSSVISVISEALPREPRIYQVSSPTTPMILRMLSDHIQEVAVLPVRLDHYRAMWIIGSDQPGYLVQFGLKHLSVAPKMLELLVTTKEHAQRDPLTGLPNRSFLGPRLTEARARSIRKKNLVAVGVLDLDGFKAVNDTFGHHAGDSILREVSSRWKKVLRSSDALIRLGGDEFVMLIEDLCNYDELDKILTRIKDETKKPFIHNNRLMHIGVSMGITIFPFDEGANDMLIHHADQALYVAKSTKKTRQEFYCLYSEKHRKSAS
ncbi:GGDEF domain-containing protein [Acidithiobacillus ferriphilus]|uniref:diguanylate cyclase domain-containing protein n=1 Tax=Acidithiobacillus ferriphilus TaxID=1689834 RepID=UPI00390C7290